MAGTTWFANVSERAYTNVVFMCAAVSCIHLLHCVSQPIPHGCTHPLTDSRVWPVDKNGAHVQLGELGDARGHVYTDLLTGMQQKH